MKPAISIIRVLVGLLFIFSGLVKANDPHGLSYKMQEYFEIWGFLQLNAISLISSVLMNAFEIIAGFALLLGWKFKFFSWLLLLLILFFTFLTGYTYMTGKPTNCGCFGDCLIITSKTSFLKDVALTLMIGFLFWNRNKIRPLFSTRLNFSFMLAIIAFGFGFQWYVLNYLPVIDCLPYKKGINISEKLKMPANAVPDSTVITFVYEKASTQIEFTADNFPADFNADTYKFIRRYDKVIRKGKNTEPPIRGFKLSGNSDIDSTETVLNQAYAILLFCEDFSRPENQWKPQFEKLYADAQAKNIPAYLVTSRIDEGQKLVEGTSLAGIQVFKCDFTAIRTAARTNPTLYLLNKGTVLGKWSFRNTGKAIASLKIIPAQQPVLPKPIPSMKDSITNE